MKFTINQTEFLKGLSLAQGIAERRTTMPMLSNALLVTDGDGSLLIRATDLYTTMSCRLESSNAVEGGIAVGAKSLYEIVKNLPVAEVHVQKTDSNHVELRSGPARFRVVGLLSDDYPEVPVAPEEGFDKVPIPTLLNLINRTLFSVSQDETRQHLSGVLLECDGDIIRMVSTDGHRLSKAEEEIKGGWPLADPILIPKKGLQELKRMMEGGDGDCELLVQEGVLFAKRGEITLSVRLIDSRFPPYEKVIPSSCDKRLVVDRMQLISALKRVSLMSEDRNKGLRMIVASEKLTIEADTPDVGEGKEDIEVDYEGESITVGFNATYLIDALARIDGDEVFLEFNEELDPCVLKPVDSENFVGVVMPLRL